MSCIIASPFAVVAAGLVLPAHYSQIAKLLSGVYGTQICVKPCIVGGQVFDLWFRRNEGGLFSCAITVGGISLPIQRSFTIDGVLEAAIACKILPVEFREFFMLDHRAYVIPASEAAIKLSRPPIMPAEYNLVKAFLHGFPDGKVWVSCGCCNVVLTTCAAGYECEMHVSQQGCTTRALVQGPRLPAVIRQAILAAWQESLLPLFGLDGIIIQA